jgi:hypothetical protein
MDSSWNDLPRSAAKALESLSVSVEEKINRSWLMMDSRVVE